MTKQDEKKSRVTEVERGLPKRTSSGKIDGESEDAEQEQQLRLFTLTLNGVTVEVCNLGASITKIRLPRYNNEEGGRTTKTHDDCVLGYDNPEKQEESGNPFYFSSVVGRVANRIANAKFELLQPDSVGDKAKTTMKTYELQPNNGPHHLHGGLDGFCHRKWNCEIVPLDDDDEHRGSTTNAVRFKLHSRDGDQGYPGDVEVEATYSLVVPAVNSIADDSGSAGAVSLRLRMSARLVPGVDGINKATPINLAQHSYFNLGGHDDSRGILDHQLTMPSSDFYTPTDATSIPTREVRSLDVDTAMDFRKTKILADALVGYATDMARLSTEQAEHYLKTTRNGETVAIGVETGQPYGFDHNYVVAPTEAGGGEMQSKQRGLNVAAIVEHFPSQRRLTVRTDAPGMQLYTANYLDGSSSSSLVEGCNKGGARYHQWQGICLETQAYPDSVTFRDDEKKKYSDFARGSCFILKPGGEEYIHNVEYTFERIEGQS